MDNSHIIGGNPDFRHIDYLDDTIYYLYDAISDAYTFLITDAGLVTDPGYGTISDALGAAMVDEQNLMNSETQLDQVIIWLSELIVVAGIDSRYEALYNLFFSLSKFDDITNYARRITVLNNTGEPLEYSKGLTKQWGEDVSFFDTKYDNNYSTSTIRLLNVQAVEEDMIVSSDMVSRYIMSLSDTDDIERIMKTNLFNYSSFSNLELRANTLFDSYDEVTADITSLFKFIEASEFFHKTQVGYETFDNYIDFDVLSERVNDIMEGFRYLSDMLDNAIIANEPEAVATLQGAPIPIMEGLITLDSGELITSDGEPYKVETGEYLPGLITYIYPTGRAQLYPLIAVLRTYNVDISIVFNSAKMFKESLEVSNELTIVEASLDFTPLDEASLIACIQVTYPALPDYYVKKIIYEDWGSSDQQQVASDCIVGFQEKYDNGVEALSGMASLKDKTKATTASFNSISKYGDKSSYQLGSVTDSLIDSMDTLSGKINNIRSLAASVSSTTLISYTFTFDLNLTLDLSVLETFRNVIQSFSRLVTSILCLAVEISSYVDFILDMKIALSTNIDATSIPILPCEFVKTEYAITDNATIVAIGRADLKSNIPNILTDLSAMTPNQLANVYSVLNLAADSLSSSHIESDIVTQYDLTCDILVDTLVPTNTMKFKPGGKFELDANLRINANLPVPNLRLGLGNC